MSGIFLKGLNKTHMKNDSISMEKFVSFYEESKFKDRQVVLHCICQCGTCPLNSECPLYAKKTFFSTTDFIERKIEEYKDTQRKLEFIDSLWVSCYNSGMIKKNVATMMNLLEVDVIEEEFKSEHKNVEIAVMEKTIESGVKVCKSCGCDKIGSEEDALFTINYQITDFWGCESCKTDMKRVMADRNKVDILKK